MSAAALLLLLLEKRYRTVRGASSATAKERPWSKGKTFCAAAALVGTRYGAIRFVDTAYECTASGWHALKRPAVYV